ncbi:MAG TPA: PQQ-binding-like beta-propeller repeat protein [Armatimonadota bacterium]
MKKLLGLVVAGLLLAGPALAQVTLSVSNVAIRPGDTGAVELRVNEAVKIGGIRANVSYGSLTPGKATLGDIWQDNRTSTQIDTSNPDFPAAGQVQVAVFSPTFGQAPGSVFSLPVTVPASTPLGTKIPVTLTVVEILDENNKDIPAGSVTIRNGSVTANPPPEVYVSSPGGKPGDRTFVNIAVNQGLARIGGISLSLDLGPLVVDGPPTADGAFTNPGDVVLEFSPKDAVGKAPGVLQIGTLTPSFAAGPGTLITLPVRIPASAPSGTAIPIVLTLKEIIDDKNVDIPGVKVTSGSITPGVGGAPEISIVGVDAAPGANTTVSVNINQGLPKVGSAHVTVDLGSLVLAGPPVAGDAFADKGKVVLEFDPKDAVGKSGQKIQIGVVSGDAATGPGTLITIPVTIPAGAVIGTPIPVGLTLQEIIDDKNADIPGVSVKSGSVTPKRALAQVRTPQSPVPNTIVVGTVAAKPVVTGQEPTDALLTVTGVNTDNLAGLDLTIEYDPAVITFVEPVAPTKPTDSIIPNPSGTDVFVTANPNYSPAGNAPPAGKRWLKLVVTGNTGTAKGVSGPLVTLKWRAAAGAATYDSAPLSFVTQGGIIQQMVLGDAAATAVDLTTAQLHSGASVIVNGTAGFSVQLGNLASGSATAFGQTLYVVDDGGMLRAFKLGTALAGFDPVNVGSPILGRPTYRNGSLYVLTSAGRVVKADATLGGTPKWSKDLGSTASTSTPAVFNDKVYVGLNDGRVVSLADADGAIVDQWTADAADGPIVSGPSVGGSGVWVGTNGGSLYALNATLQVQSKITIAPSAGDLLAQLSSSPFIVAGDGQGQAFVGGTDGKVHRFNASTGGNEVASPAGPAPIFAPVFVLGSLVYALDEAETVRVIDAATMAETTSKDFGTRALDAQAPIRAGYDPAGSDANLYVPDQDGNLRIVKTDGTLELLGKPVLFAAQVSAPAITNFIRDVTDVVAAVNSDGSLVAIPIWGTPPTPPPPSTGGLPGPAGNGKVDMNITDTTTALSNTITAAAGSQVTVQVNVDADAKNLQGVEFVLDSSEKSAGAPDLTGKVTSGTQVQVDLGSIFTPGGAIPPLVLGNQIAAGQVKVVLAYLNTDKPGNGPGPIVSVPLEIPASAPAGSTWTLRLTGVSVNGDTVLTTGNLGTATVKVEGTTPPPPPVSDGKVDLTVGDATGATTITAKAGDEVMLAINADVDAKNVQGVELVLDSTQKSAGAPDLTGKVASGTQVTANLGSMFTPGGAIPPLVLGNQTAAGQIKVVIAYLNTDKPANGPGQLATVPIEIPATAPAGASWTVKLTGVSVSGDNPLTIGTTGTVTISIAGTPPPPPPAGGGLPGPAGDAKVDMNITDTTAALGNTITGAAGSEVIVQINVDADAKNVQGVELVLDSTQKSAGAPDLTGKVTSGTQVTANLGGIFTPGGPIPALVLANQAAAGQIKLVLAYLNTDKPGNGPGSILSVPLVIPAGAPAGATWTLKLTGVTVNGDTDLPLGTLGTATVKVGS